MSLMPAVRASLAERFIFNLRLPPRELAAYLPVPWLVPQEIKGWSVASFCILDLRGITVAPLTTSIGLESVSCAPRYGVLDLSHEPPTPAVFVTERQTASAFSSWLTTLGFPAIHPRVDASIDHGEEQTRIMVRSPEGELLFSATVHTAAADSIPGSVTLDAPSELFASPAEFSAFIAQGVSSFGPSRHGDRLTRVDLHKEDATYTPVTVSGLQGAIVEDWQRHGGIFDSAYRTTGGRYEWTYLGLTDPA